jgi:hypothetical protein
VPNLRLHGEADKEKILAVLAQHEWELICSHTKAALQAKQ